MKIKHLPNNDTEGVAMLTHVIKIEGEEEDPEDFLPEGVQEGTYARDTKGRIWKLDEAATLLFQGLGGGKK